MYFEPDRLIGHLLADRYRLQSVIGKGAHGVVYRALDQTLGRSVAVKLLPTSAHAMEVIRRFEREAKALSQLNHPRIVTIQDYGVARFPYVVTELLSGETLGQLLASQELELSQVVPITRGILHGLVGAHAQGVLHRDLKPANVYLQDLPDVPRYVTLLDFGLAKLRVSGRPDESSMTGYGEIVGTPAYMSPEQATGERVDARSDVYAVGVMMFEMLALRPPFDQTSQAEVMRAHLVEAVPNPAFIRPGLRVSKQGLAFLNKALAKRPDERFATANEMLVALDALPSDTFRFRTPSLDMNLSSQSRTLDGSLESSSRRRGFLIGALALVLGFAGTAGGLTWYRMASHASEESEIDVLLSGYEQEMRASDKLIPAVHRKVRKLQRRFPDNPRPSLLLAQDFARHGFFPAVLERLELAYSKDESVLEDPQVVELTLDAVSDSKSNRAAHDFFVRHYKDNMAATVLKRANREIDSFKVTRLMRLHSELKEASIHSAAARQ